MSDDSHSPNAGSKAAKPEAMAAEAALPSSVESGAAKQLLSRRRQREALLGLELAREPAWTLLLELFVAYEEKRPLEIPQLCANAGVSPEIAFRWLSTLASEGMILRRSPASDPHWARVELSPLAADQLRTLLRSWLEE